MWIMYIYIIKFFSKDINFWDYKNKSWWKFRVELSYLMIDVSGISVINKMYLDWYVMEYWVISIEKWLEVIEYDIEL